MMLSAEALDIVNFLKTAPGKYVSMLEISRRAGGRRRFEESPSWAKNLMSPLVADGVLEVNARGHYRLKTAARPEAPLQAGRPRTPLAQGRPKARIVGDDYFPTMDLPRIVGGDYFPNSG